MKNKIRAIIAGLGLTQAEFAKLLNLSKTQFNGKLNGSYEFKKSEIDCILEISGKTYEEIFLHNSTRNSNSDKIAS